MDGNVMLTEQTPRKNSAAARMRLARQRRREGLRCMIIELRETEIDVLIRKGLLQEDCRRDKNAIVDALYDFFDETLGRTP